MSKRVLAVAICWLLSSQFALAEVATGGSVGDDKFSVVYDSDTGDLSFDSAGKSVVTLEAISDASLFQQPECDLLGGLFDVNAPNKIFKLAPEGWLEFKVANALPKKLTAAAVAKDLTVDGSYMEGGPIRDVDLVVVNSGASTDAASHEAPKIQAYVFQLTEFTVEPLMFPRLASIHSADELNAVEDELRKANAGAVTKKLQSTIRAGESTTTTITTNRSASVTPESRRGAHGRITPQTFSVTLDIEAKGEDSVGVRLSINSGSAMRRTLNRSGIQLSSYIEAPLNKPVAVFAASGKETKVIMLTLTKL